MFLCDTNIFLEILLEQEKRELCKDFLQKNRGHLHISDFSLYSIAVILFRLKRWEAFEEFIKDVLPLIPVVILDKRMYSEIVVLGKGGGMDFDDAYQAILAKYKRLTLVTMDKNFKQLESKIKIQFL